MASSGAGDADLAIATEEVAKEKLRFECQILREELQKVQSQLADKQAIRPIDVDNPLTSIYTAKESLLIAQLDRLKNKEPAPVLTNSDIQFEALREDLTRSVSELRVTRAVVQNQHKELAKERLQEANITEELQALQLSLKDKLSDPTLGAASIKEIALLKDLKGKETKLVAYYKKIMQQLALFVQQHFPPPTDQQIEEWRRKNSTHQHNGEWLPFVSLKTILEDLMNNCIDTPFDPWITLDNTHWPPYIELLLRCGIALRHPDDVRRIKLTPFHF